MNCSIRALVLTVFFMLLSNLYLGSCRMTRQSNSDLRNFENEGQRKPKTEDERTREERWRLDSGENSDTQAEMKTDKKQRTESEGESLNELSNTQGNEPGMKDNSENVELSENTLVNGKVNIIHGQYSKHRRQFKNHSSRSNRKRHNRKFKEIEELHSELRHVVADLEEISEKENELEHEIDELNQSRHTSKTRAKQIKHKESNTKHRLETPLARVKNDEHHTSYMDRSTEDNEFGSVETEVRDLEDQDVLEDQDAEEMKDHQKEFGEVVSKNSELRRKNKELCRLLHISLTRQKDLGAEQGNGDFYEQLDRLSSETGETLEDQFRHACGRSYNERKIGHREKPKLQSSEDLEKTDEAEREKDSGGSNRKGPRRKAKKERQSLKTRNADQDKTESSRQHNDHNSETQNSQQKLHKMKLSKEEGGRNSEYEAEEEILLGNDKMETDETSPRTGGDDTDQSNGKNESLISSASANLQRVDEVPLIFADGKYSEEEEEANITISTEDEDKQKVYDHIASVDEVTFCDKPRPVVIYPSDHYPVPKKYYTPQGTILHRCSKHSGCCPNEQLTCVPAKKEKVILHFFAAVLDGSGSIVPHIEKLLFMNHTKCGCVYKHHAHLYL